MQKIAILDKNGRKAKGTLKYDDCKIRSLGPSSINHIDRHCTTAIRDGAKRIIKQADIDS